jgi:hypothetical protein
LSSCSPTVDALALRIDRSLARVREVVAELDRDALGRRRRITRPLALAVLERMEAADGRQEAGEEAQDAEAQDSEAQDAKGGDAKGGDAKGRDADPPDEGVV